MKKYIAYILLSLHVFFTGNPGVFFYSNIEKAQAATNTWPLTTESNYTLSDDTLIDIKDGIGDLNLTLIQTGSLANNGTTVFLDRAMRVHVIGDYAYVSAQTQDRIQVIDISDPTNPTAETNLQNNGTTLMLDGPRDFASTGSYLFISENVGDAIQTIDISDPTAPTAAGNFPNAGGVRLNGPRGLAVQGNYLYVATWNDDALQVFDISTPTNLVDAGELDTANGRLNGARDIIVEGDYAYISARNDDSLQVVDISTPSTPSFAGELTNGGAVTLDSVFGIDKQGDYIYAAGYNQDAIQVIDVSTPTAPTAVTSVGTTIMPNLNGPRDVVADGDFLFVADFIGDSIMILDISDPTDPTFEYELPNSALVNINGPRDLQRVGNLLHVSMFSDDDFVTLETEYNTTSPTIIPTTPFDYTGENLSSFTQVLGGNNQGNITYQISKDNGVTWYYHDGSSWSTTTNGVADSNSASDINTNISDFDALGGGTDEFLWKAFLSSDGSQKVELDSITVNSVAPGPGGVNTNLELWLKADEGTSTTTDGAALATWDDQSGNNLDASGVVDPIYRSNDTDSLNFNPVIDFNGSTQYMNNLAGGAYTDSYFLVVIPDSNVEGTSSQGVPFGWDCLSGTLSSGTCGLSFAGIALGTFTAAFPDEVITHALGSSVNWRSAQTAIAIYDSGKPMLIEVNENTGGTGTDIYEKGIQVNNATANTYQTLSTADYYLGRSGDGAFPFFYDGKIAEVINYSGRVEDSNRNKIESYLSLKYGITLGDGMQNYIASDGSTTYWSPSTAGVYTNDIFGIGRDDTTSLGQIKSKSVNDGTLVTVEASGEGTNASPSFVDMGNLEFLTISNDGGGNTWTATDTPATYNILSRKWKVQETGEIGNMAIDFDVGDTNFDIPALNAGTSYYFISDTDGDGNLSDETPSSMTNTSGNIWQITGINLDDEEIFTIATQASSNNIPTDIILSNNTINENIADGSSVGNLSTTDADGGDIHSYSLVLGTGDEDNSLFTISGNTLTINYSPDYELKASYNIRIETNDGNGGTYQEAFNVNINNIGESTTTTIDFENISNEQEYTVTSGQWNRNTNNPQEGSFSLESDNLGVDATQSCFEVNHNATATGTIDFYYEVSSEVGSDFLRFYIDNVEELATAGTIPYTQYTSGDIAPGPHEYKWCYIKDGLGSTGTDNAHIDIIQFQNSSGDVIPPTISAINHATGSLLPGGNHDVIISYSDSESSIDTSSDGIALYKWNGSTWGADISTTGFDLGSKIVSATGATYPTNNLDFGKYRYDFDISDNDGNQSSTGAIFYIDIPELTISTGSIDIGNVDSFTNNFSDTVTVTVRTVGAEFDVTINRSSNLTEGTQDIPSWDGVKGYGYDQSPFSSSISTIGTNEIIATQSGSINIDGNKNTYTYDIQIGALIEDFQTAGDYAGNIDFSINLTY